MTNGNVVEDLFSAIDRGREGKNIGIKTGIPKMDGYTGGIQKKTYYLLFGLSGAGKSSLALYSYIYRPLKDNPDGNFIIVYFSLEMSSKLLLAKLLSLYLYETYNIIVSYSDLMSWKGILTDEMYEYVKQGKAWLEQITKRLIIYDKSLNRDKFYSTMMDILEKNGKFVESEDKRRSIYIPNDPNKLILGVVDPINLAFPKPGATKKDEIDAISAYAVSLRERCEASFLFLQQENRNSSGMDRRKAELTESSAEDLKDSGNTYNDAEVCIGVYYPLKHKLKTCHGYPIISNDPTTPFEGLRDRYRGLCLIKNRNGESEKYVSVNFFGEIGLFKELPKVETIKDYSPFLSLTPEESGETKDEIQQESSNKIIYKF